MAPPDRSVSADRNNKSKGMSKLFDKVLFLANTFELSRLDKCVLKTPKERFMSHYIHFAFIVILNLIALFHLQGLFFFLHCFSSVAFWQLRKLLPARQTGYSIAPTFCLIMPCLCRGLLGTDAELF